LELRIGRRVFGPIHFNFHFKHAVVIFCIEADTVVNSIACSLTASQLLFYFLCVCSWSDVAIHSSSKSSASIQLCQRRFLPSIDVPRIIVTPGTRRNFRHSLSFKGFLTLQIDTSSLPRPLLSRRFSVFVITCCSALTAGKR
jgi:hypothetical protein